MRVAWWALVGALGVLWLGWLAKGRAAGWTKRLAFRATLITAVALLVRLGLTVGPGQKLSFEVSLLLAAPLLLAYLYLVRFCPRCGLMQRNLKPAVCARCGAALPRHGMTSLPRRTGHEARRPGRFFGRPGNGTG
jgi:hypothetical protein